MDEYFEEISNHKVVKKQIEDQRRKIINKMRQNKNCRKIDAVWKKRIHIVKHIKELRGENKYLTHQMLTVYL